MVSPFPWKIDDDDASIVRDAEGTVIARNYQFLHVDDFEAIVKITQILALGERDTTSGVAIKQRHNAITYFSGGPKCP